MLHAWDGRNEWECGVKWGGNDGAFDETGEHWGLPKRKQNDGSFVTVAPHAVAASHSEQIKSLKLFPMILLICQKWILIIW